MNCSESIAQSGATHFRSSDVVDQIISRLSRDEFPLFVAEGDSSDEAVRIRDGGYQAKARSSFRGALNDAKSVLFTVGHSLADVDSHLFEGFRARKFKRVYVGAYGGLGSADGQRAEVWAIRWPRSGRRRSGRPCQSLCSIRRMSDLGLTEVDLAASTDDAQQTS